MPRIAAFGGDRTGARAFARTGAETEALPGAGAAAGGTAAGPLVSVIVPTLDEERVLLSLLHHLAGLAGHFEFVVADGGSTDATVACARAHALAPRVVEATGGRARQLNVAAEGARGDLFVFLHADSRLPPGAYSSLASAWRDPAVVGGNFALRFEGDDLFARALAAVYAAQRRLGYFYGDSSIWVRPADFAALGGFREIPVMEDYDLARRLARRGRVACLAGPARTSSRRWRRIGVARTVLTWTTIRWLYLLGVPPERLAGLYRNAR